ncbi:MAG TPA: tryptophan 2,3-dioxygenase family protein [Pseudonocardiaceae bacterium]
MITNEAPVADLAPVSEYHSYLALTEVLGAQRPRTGEPDEMMFIVVHQVHELWFKLLLHELAVLQQRLTSGDTTAALHTLGRALSILDVLTSPIDVLDTLTPNQFSRFRAELGTSSGAQSRQFREIEALLGRRDRRAVECFTFGSEERTGIEAAMARPSVFDSLLRYLVARGYPVPDQLRYRDVAQPLESSVQLQRVLATVYRDDGGPAQVCERLVEIDQRMQEWRYRHVSMVERIIGQKPGTGGSSGASYLRTTLAKPMFPDLWVMRSKL